MKVQTKEEEKEMNPMLELLAILGAVILLALMLLDATKPKFYKLDMKTKRAVKKMKRTGKANLKALRAEIQDAHANGKIDKIEKAYLLRRTSQAELIVMGKLNHRDPRYKPGDDADLLN